MDIDLKAILEDNTTRIIFGIVVFVITIALSRLLTFFFRRFVLRSSKILKNNPTNYRFLLHFMNGVLYLVAIGVILYTLPGGRSLAISLFAGAGVFAAIIGLASQQAFSNIISGIFIVIFKPFRVDDLVQIGQDYMGHVEDITLRHTVIRDFQNRRIIIPNSVISEETVLNSSILEEKICRHVEFGISFDSDIDLARKILREEALAHKNCIDMRTPEDIDEGRQQVEVRVIRFSDSAIILRAWVWTEGPMQAFELHTDLNESVKKRFDAEGVEIPFPYRTVVFKDKEQAKKINPDPE